MGPVGLFVSICDLEYPYFLSAAWRNGGTLGKDHILFANNMPVPRFREGLELWLEGSRLSMNKTHHDNHCSFHQQLIQRQISRLEAARWGHGAGAAHTVHWKCTRESMRCLQTKAIILQRRQSFWTQQQTSSSYATFIYNIWWCNDVSYNILTSCIPHDYCQITLSLLSGCSIAMHADLHMLTFHSAPPLLCDYPCKSCIEVRPGKKTQDIQSNSCNDKHIWTT